MDKLKQLMKEKKIYYKSHLYELIIKYNDIFILCNGNGSIFPFNEKELDNLKLENNILLEVTQ